MKQTLSVVASFVLLAAGMAMGQSMTSSGSGQWNPPTTISNFPDVLVSGGNVNAWHSMPGIAVNVTSNQGSVVVVNSANQGYTYSGVKSNSWNYHSEWGAVTKVEYGNDGKIYGLIGASPNSCPGNGAGHDFARFDSPNWTVLTYCFENFQLATDGGSAVLLEDVNGTLWTGDLVNGGWQHVAGAPYPVFDAVPVVSPTSGVSLSYYALKTDHTIWLGNGSSTVQLPGAALAVASAGDDDSDLFVIGTDNNPYHYNGATGGWDRIASSGSLTAIAADPFAVWSIGPLVNSENIYSLALHGLEWTRTYSGTVTCNVPPPYGQQICPTFHHTAALQICTNRKCGATVNATPWNNSGSWNLTSKVHTNDGWDCLLQNDPTSDCQVYENVGQMQCSSGANNNDTKQDGPGVSFDVIGFSKAVNFAGPTPVGTPYVGEWLGNTKIAVYERCPGVSVSTCPVGPYVVSTFSCRYSDATGVAGIKCYGDVKQRMLDRLGGVGQPWVVIEPYVRIQGVEHCSGVSGPLIPYGNDPELLPDCQ